MEENKQNNNKQGYKEDSSTGMLGGFLFAIFMIVSMIILLHFVG